MNHNLRKLVAWIIKNRKETPIVWNEKWWCIFFNCLIQALLRPQILMGWYATVLCLWKIWFWKITKFSHLWQYWSIFGVWGINGNICAMAFRIFYCHTLSHILSHTLIHSSHTFHTIWVNMAKYGPILSFLVSASVFSGWRILIGDHQSNSANFKGHGPRKERPNASPTGQRPKKALCTS